ncbi:hypothetical protein ONE63_009254 [Megalurothrips usitatus]|uniref:Uncharacterized protein n=1 Tax=Megalurothrips usitatus TaxID=439358 RepID=A0AAV7XJ30_9NEOP|nr:hypothetical protein ONE63_009254 [Megalurothrips usitatus]
METISVSIPPPLPPKTRKKLQVSSCGSQLRPLSALSAPTPAAVTAPAPGPAPGPPGPQPGAHQTSAAADRVHVVSIRIRPEEPTAADGCVRISVGGTPPPPAAMVTRNAPPSPDAAFLFYNGVAVTTSGQASPVDSGTCSDDADGGVATPPPLPRKTLSPSARLASRPSCVRVNDPEDEPCSERCSSNMSCDSLNSLDKVACFLGEAKLASLVAAPAAAKLSPAALPAPASPDTSLDSASGVSPAPVVCAVRRKLAVEERTYEDRRGPSSVGSCSNSSSSGSSSSSGVATPPDHYYDFHLNEREDGGAAGDEEDTFAGHRDYTLDAPVTVPATIRSSKGTVRGVRNRVRAGVATFLSIQHNKVSE